MFTEHCNVTIAAMLYLKPYSIEALTVKLQGHFKVTLYVYAICPLNNQKILLIYGFSTKYILHSVWYSACVVMPKVHDLKVLKKQHHFIALCLLNLQLHDT